MNPITRIQPKHRPRQIHREGCIITLFDPIVSCRRASDPWLLAVKSRQSGNIRKTVWHLLSLAPAQALDFEGQASTM
jgi:hypothetical protein